MIDDYADTDPRPVLTADALETELRLVMESGRFEWMLQAFVEVAVNGDAGFLQRMTERHVDGWRTP